MSARLIETGRLPDREGTEGAAYGLRVPRLGMPMRARPMPSFLAVIVTVVLGAGAALALDAAPRPQPLTPALTPVIKYGSVREALQSGMRDYNAGDKRGAAQALEYAAGQGHTLALWKLGRMYADGDGVQHDDLRALAHLSTLAAS